jgi:hypothetical protein
MNTLARSVAARWRIARDDGAAMVLVMAWSLVVFGLALVIVQSVIRQIGPSDHAERSYAALAAAEAGIEDYRARLLVPRNYTYYSKPDPTNPALGGWATVPGGNTTAQYTYAVDSGRAGVGGGLTIVSTGRSQGVTRTVQSVLARRSTLDYVYMSDIESTAPTLPAAYSTAPDSGGTGHTAQELAGLLCARHWWDYDKDGYWVSATTKGNQRNQSFCQWAGIYSSERLTGKVHTNDVWRLGASSMVPVFSTADSISSSCPTTTDAGYVTGAVACPASHRFVENTDSTVYANNKNLAIWLDSDTPNGTRYQGNTWTPGGSVSVNPIYDSVLELPPNANLMLTHASNTGCVYTGPTRIRFALDTDLSGIMWVTSPDTKDTTAACAGGTRNGLAVAAGTGAPQKTVKVRLSDFTNLVIYVQNVPRTGDRNLSTDRTPVADTVDNAFVESNIWATLGTEPTCVVKSGKKYPYVIPAAPGAELSAQFNSGSTYNGFPSELADPGSPYYGSSCASGDVYVQGIFKGSATIASANNIIVTSHLVTSDGTAGAPAACTANCSMMGLVANNFAYVYRPFAAPTTTTFLTGTVGTPTNGGTTATITFTTSSPPALTVGGPVSATNGTGKVGTGTSVTSVSGKTINVSANGLVKGTITNVTLKSSAWVGDWKESNATDIKIDAAILAVNQCWASQREYSGNMQGSIHLWGSLAQKYRCAVGPNTGATIEGGFAKAYLYDNRLHYQTPPYMVELSSEPWKRNQYTELTPVVQSAATRSWPLATANDLVAPAATFGNLVVAYGPPATAATLLNGGTASLAQAQVALTSYPLATGKSGLVLLTYDVTKSVGSPAVAYTETRRLAIQVK